LLELRTYASMKAVIIAAGTGSRLWPHTNQVPKTLLPFGEGTILSQIMSNFATIGIAEFVIVVGFGAAQIVEYVASAGLGSRVTFVENRDWHRGNGLSVHLVRGVIGMGSFLLSMSDHLVSPPALAHLMAARSDQNLLLVDPWVEGVFDLPDATKVRLEGAHITGIGKGLVDFNAIDCGVFRLDERFFEAMECAIRQGQESISEGIRHLIETRAIGGVCLPDGSRWIDIDTPEAYAYALAHRQWYV
jgi:choline kinase